MHKKPKQFKEFLLTIFLVLLTLVLVNFVSAGYVWNSDSESYSFNEGGDLDGEGLAFKGAYYEVIYNNGEVSEENVEGTNKKITLKIESGGSIEISGSKYDLDFSEENEFVFNEKGELIKGTHFKTKEGIFRIKNYDVPLPENTEVIYEEEKIVFKLLKGLELEIPEKVEELGEGEKEILFSYQGENLNLNENIFFGDSEIGFDNGFFIQGKEYNIGKENGEFLLLNNGGKKFYVLSDESELKENSIFIGDKRLVMDSQEKGLAIFFKQGNRYGFQVEGGKTAAVQAREGRVFIEASKEGEVPIVKLSGRSIVNLDKRTFFAENNEMYFNPKKGLILGFAHGDLPVKSSISLVDNNEKNIKDFNVYANDRDQYAAVNPSSFKTPAKIYKTKLGFYASPNVAFNDLTLDAQKFYERMRPEAQEHIFDMAVKGIAGNGIGGAQAIIDNLIEEERRRNPILASVRIPSGGGSGTIIGVDKEGYPIVLTAGHLGGATRPGYQERIQLTDGRQFKGTVIGGLRDYSGSGNDFSLIKINSKVPDIPYVPVAGEAHEINQGDPALRIGCPGCGKFKQSKTVIGRIGSGTIRVTDRIYGGESGGGLFHNGRVVGVVSTTGDYTGTARIRGVLTKYGYDYLIVNFILSLKSCFVVFLIFVKIKPLNRLLRLKNKCKHMSKIKDF